MGHYGRKWPRLEPRNRGRAGAGKLRYPWPMMHFRHDGTINIREGGYEGFPMRGLNEVEEEVCPMCGGHVYWTIRMDGGRGRGTFTTCLNCLWSGW